MSATLIIFVKNPVAGKTKTRLASSVGHDKALEMYRMLMSYTEKQASALKGVTRLLCYSEQVSHEDEWPEDLYEKDVQVGAGLGDRMENAFKQAFSAGAERAIIIGSDCPGVTTELLQNAFTALDQNDLVIGPALDGGYYLLGMRALHTPLFRNMTWSVDSVATETLNRAKALGLKAAALMPLSDVDYLEDWESYGWEIP